MFVCLLSKSHSASVNYSAMSSFGLPAGHYQFHLERLRESLDANYSILVTLYDHLLAAKTVVFHRLGGRRIPGHVQCLQKFLRMPGVGVYML